MIYVGERIIYWQNNIGFFSPQCLAPDILLLFTAGISLPSLLFTSWTDKTASRIHEVTSALWKLIRSCIQITVRWRTGLTLSFPESCLFHSAVCCTCSPAAWSTALRLRAALLSWECYLVYQVWSRTVCNHVKQYGQVICRQVIPAQGRRGGSRQAQTHTCKSQTARTPHACM